MKVKLLFAVTCIMLVASLMFAATTPKQIANGKKAKVTGTIVSRSPASDVRIASKRCLPCRL